MIEPLAVAIAAGLNPYAALLLVAALATWTPRLSLVLPWVGVPPVAVMYAIVIVAGLALPLDLVFGKLTRLPASQGTLRRLWLSPATLSRCVGLLVAPITGTVLAMGLVGPQGSFVTVALSGGSLATATWAMLTISMNRAQRSSAWAGLGHIPILIAATTAACIIIPLAVVQAFIGLAVGLLVVVGLLAASVLAGRGTARHTSLPGASSPRSAAPRSAAAHPGASTPESGR